MDQRLILALENLGNALEEIASSLQSKGKPKTSGVEAMKSGDFGKQLESISKQLTSIKADTQAILKEQKTIQSMSKQKETKKETPMEEIGKDKKKESALKKGLGTILLIAVAVLAIGMAFKLVGKIDFLSVIALGLAIYVVAEAFAKIAALNLSLREAFVTSLVMVLLSVGVTISSYILARITPVGLIQLMTAVAIAGVFATIGMSLEKIATAFVIFDRILGKRATHVVPLIMVAISIAITASSYVMKGIIPIGVTQALTAIAIAGVFMIIGMSLVKIAESLAIIDKILGEGKVKLFPIVLVAIAAAITFSSWIMSLIMPLGIFQALTAIAISIIFVIIGIQMAKIAIAITLIDKILGEKKAARLFPLVLVAIATAITFSSWILSLVTPLSLFQFLTALGIAILFAVMSYFFIELAVGIYIIDKVLGKKGLLAVPLIFVALSIAIMLSSHILAMTAEMTLSQVISIAAFGIGLGLVMLAMLPSVLLVGLVAASGVGAGAIALGVLMVPLIALAVMISSHILAMGKYDKYPGLGWVASVGIIMTNFSLVVLGLGIIAVTGVGLVAILAGVLLVPVIAATIVATDKIIATGDYGKYPGLGWVMSVGVVMTGFGSAVLALGIIAVTGVGLIAILAGVLLVPMIAESIVATDKVIGKGKYNKYPGIEWILSIGVVMTGFGAAVLGLGIIAVTGVGLIAILAGVLLVPMIAASILATDKIIGMGKYNKYPGIGWILSIGVVMTGFGAAVLALGIIAVTGVGLIAILAGALLVPLLAATILATDKIIGMGKYDKYPGIKWILSVGVSMVGFGSAVLALGIIAISGVGLIAILAGVLLVPLIAKSIADSSKIISKGTYTKGPSIGWALGVSSLMVVFGLAVLTLGSFIVGSLGLGYVALKAGQQAVKIIAQSIVDVAVIFNKNSSAFKFGPKKEWAEGVSIAIGAFAPVYKMLMRGGIMTIFSGIGPSPQTFARAIRTIARGIVDAALFFNSPEARAGFTNGPKKEWSEGVGKAIGAFAPVYKMLVDFPFSGGDKMKRAIIIISKGIIASAGIFSKFKARFDSYPSVKWAQGVGGALKAFAPVYKILKDFPYSGGDKMKRAIIIISTGIVDTAKVFARQKDWKTYPTGMWNYNVKMAVANYMIMSKSSSKFDLNSDKLPKIAYRISQVANIFYKNRKSFGNSIVDNVTKWGQKILNPAGIFHQYITLSKFLKAFDKSTPEMGPGKSKTSGGLLSFLSPIAQRVFVKEANSNSTGDIVADTALKLVRVASILHQGEKFFKLNIDPNYMKKVGKNILDFNHIVMMLAKSEKGSLMGSIGKGINNLFGNDPISKIANRMVILAGAYDKLATSLIKLGTAMRMLNIRDARMLGGITTSIVNYRVKDNKEGSQSRPEAGPRSEGTRFREKNTTGGGGGIKGGSDKDEKMFKKMDEILKVLKSIDRSVSSVDDYILDIAGISSSDKMF